MDKKVGTDKRVLKTSVTKLKDKISKADINSCDAENLELFKSKIEKINFEMEELFKTILANCKEEEIDSFLDEKEEIQETVDEMHLVIKKEIAQRSKSSVISCSSKPEVTEVKLPTIGLPSFSGRIEEWLSFRDLFTASVENNKSLSPAQKLQYLKLSCKGDASKIIQSIPLEDSKYAIAWDLLKERFSNKRELIYTQIKKIISLPNVNSESTSSILNIVDTLNESVRSFEILDQKVSGFSETLIIYLILQKLDQNIKIWWERQLKVDELPTLEKLTDFLKDFARSLQSSKTNFGFKKNINHSKITTMTAAVVNFDCKYCNSKNHKIYKPTEVISLF